MTKKTAKRKGLYLHNRHQKLPIKSQNIHTWNETLKVILLSLDIGRRKTLRLTQIGWNIQSHICFSGGEKDQNPAVWGPMGDMLWNHYYGHGLMFKSQSCCTLIPWLRQLGWVHLTFLSQDVLIFEMGIMLTSEKLHETFNRVVAHPTSVTLSS